MSRAEQKADTRAKLIEVARKAFLRDGYDRTTFRTMAVEAGTSTGAFFSNWPDKAALFQEATGLSPDLSEVLARVIVTCSGYPGALGELSEDMEKLRRWYYGASA